MLVHSFYTLGLIIKDLDQFFLGKLSAGQYEASSLIECDTIHKLTNDMSCLQQFAPFRYRIHLRTVSRWRHLAMYIAPVTVCSLFFNIPMFINLQVQHNSNVVLFTWGPKHALDSCFHFLCCPKTNTSFDWRANPNMYLKDDVCV